MTEQDVLEQEDRRLECGAEPRDLSTYTAWRETTDACVLGAIEFYGEYLMGQTNGWSDALSLPALATAMDIEGVPEEDRPETARRVLLVHGVYMTTLRRKEKLARGR